MAQHEGVPYVDTQAALEHGLITALSQLRTFFPYPPGQKVTIDMIGVDIDGVQIEKDHSVYGTLIDPKHAIIEVDEALQLPEIRGCRIGLGVRTYISTPVGMAAQVAIRCCVARNRSGVYYLPEDVPADSETGCPPQTAYRELTGRYGRVIVGATSIFE